MLVGRSVALGRGVLVAVGSSVAVWVSVGICGIAVGVRVLVGDGGTISVVTTGLGVAVTGGLSGRHTSSAQVRRRRNNIAMVK